MQSEAEKWASILHVSQFAGYLIPLAGFIAPLMIWQIKKEEYPSLDAHGREVMNWIISEIIYWCVCVVLIFVFFIGIPLLILLGILGIVFPIIGAIKASEGDFWRYPFTIRFF